MAFKKILFKEYLNSVSYSGKNYTNFPFFDDFYLCLHIVSVSDPDRKPRVTDLDPARVLDPCVSESTTLPSTVLISLKIYMLHIRVGPEPEPQRDVAPAPAK
jgi:hypothetical protein